MGKGAPCGKASMPTTDADQPSHQPPASWQCGSQKADERIEFSREETGEILPVSIFYFERDFFDTLRRILIHLHTPESQVPRIQLFPAPAFFLEDKTAHTSPCFLSSLGISKADFSCFLLKQSALELWGGYEPQDEYVHLPSLTPHNTASRTHCFCPFALC